MPPARTRKQEVAVSPDEAMPVFTAPPAAPSTRTPERSPAKRMTGITQAQKQALIDNLQLEITERARKLRAQYAMQAQQLRSRLEMRINRIPQALRKRTMQDLMEEHAEKAKPAPPPSMPAAPKPQAVQSHQVVASPKQVAKRKSDDISAGDDKENVPSQPMQDLGNPKKRAKTAAATANSKATRTASRKIGPGGVLSPKSHNSRTLPRSPLKASNPAPERPQPARAALSAQATASRPPSRMPSRQLKQRPAATASDGRSSEASTTSSAGTTIVSKPGTRKNAPAAARKAVPTKPAAAAGRKVAVGKKELTAPSTTTGRTLRKRT